MFIYLFVILFAYITWKVRDYLQFDEHKNVSKSSIPVIKTSFNLTFKSQEEIFEYLRKSANKFQCSYLHFPFGIWSYEVCRANDAEKILGSSKHIDKSPIYNFLHPFLRTGLLTSKGEKWHTRRRLLTPAFHFNILREFFDIFNEESEKLVSTLKQEEGNDVDITAISAQFTLNTILETAMGVKLSGLGSDAVVYRKNIYLVGKILLSRLLKPWLISDFMYSLLGYRKKLDQVLKPVHNFTKSIIEQRRENFVLDINSNKSVHFDDNIYFRSKKRRYAMLDTLLQAQVDGLIDDKGIIEETDTFTFEGHDTTSSAISFCLLLIGHHPEVQNKILTEMQEILETKDESSIDDFNKLEYLDRVVKECLRIYPPVPFISRELSEDFIHDGYIQPKGTGCNIHIFDIHRDPEIFPQPENFNPDRFLPENCAVRSNFAFIPFSAGVRNCIGQRFAMLEVKTVLTKLIRNFEIISITKREDIVFLADLVLRSKFPIKIKFFFRN